MSAVFSHAVDALLREIEAQRLLTEDPRSVLLQARSGCARSQTILADALLPHIRRVAAEWAATDEDARALEDELLARGLTGLALAAKLYRPREHPPFLTFARDLICLSMAEALSY